MAFVFRSEKAQQQSKPNPTVGPGIYHISQVLTTSKSIMRIRSLKLMFLLAACNLNLDKITIM